MLQNEEVRVGEPHLRDKGSLNLEQVLSRELLASVTRLSSVSSLPQVLDDKNVRRRFRASNYQSTTRVKPFICTMPMRLDDGWNQIQFNLSDFTRRAYGTNYIETLRVQVSSRHVLPTGANLLVFMLAGTALLEIGNPGLAPAGSSASPALCTAGRANARLR